MVPAPVERSQLPGHRQRSQIPQHRQWYSVNRLRCRHARARGAAPIPARSEADRPAPAGSAALRLLADVDISFSRNCCWQLRLIGRRRWCRRRSSAASCRVIGNDRKFRSTDSGTALTACAAVTRAREAGANSSALGGRPTCTGRLGGAAAAGRRRHFFFAELLLADSAVDAGARATGADADVGFA